MERVAAIRCRTRVRSWRMAGARAGPRPFRLGAGRARGRLLARSPELMARADSLAKLAFAYGVHLTRRRLTRPRSQLATLLEPYAHNRLPPPLPAEPQRLPPPPSRPPAAVRRAPRKLFCGRIPAVSGCESSTFCIQSVEITLHLAPMVNPLLRPLRRWPALEAAVSRLAGRFTTWPSDEFGRFISASVTSSATGGPAALPPAAKPMRPPPPVSIAPANLEMRFMKLHAEGLFVGMWGMLA